MEKKYKSKKERHFDYLKNVNFTINAFNLYQLTMAEANVYSLAKSYWRQKNTFYMSSKNIGITLNLSERHVQRVINSLEKKGFLVVERHANKRILREPTANELYAKATEEYRNLFEDIKYF